jgi:hypothetical protein
MAGGRHAFADAKPHKSGRYKALQNAMTNRILASATARRAGLRATSYKKSLIAICPANND